MVNGDGGMTVMVVDVYVCGVLCQHRRTTRTASQSVETSARTPDWDVGAASGVGHERGGAAAPLRSTNHAHCFAEAIVTRAAGLHRRHARTKSHSAPDSGNGLLGAGKSLAAWWASRHHHAMVLQCWPPAPSSSSHGPCAGHGPMTPAQHYGPSRTCRPALVLELLAVAREAPRLMPKYITHDASGHLFGDGEVHPDSV